MSFNYAPATSVRKVVNPGTYAAPKAEEPVEDFALVFDTGSDGCVIEGTATDLLDLAALIVSQLSIDARYSDNYVCRCGNEPSTGGWDRALPDGTALDRYESPTDEQEVAWAERREYVCCDCGVVVSSADRDAITTEDDAPGTRLPIVRIDPVPAV